MRDGQDGAYEALGVTVSREFRPTKEYPKGQEVYALAFDGVEPAQNAPAWPSRRGSLAAT